jgi:23S rRNA pseudouridine2605 synthase
MNAGTSLGMTIISREQGAAMEERLQKLIARAGITSRRRAEQLMEAGEVTVNGRVVTELGSKADPERDRIKVSGRVLRFPEEKTYIVLNKPAGCVATMSDPEGRPTLRNYLHGVPGRVFPVGRLDFHTEGLLLLTTDGDLANGILRGGGHLPQTYWLKVKAPLGPKEIAELGAKTGLRLRMLKSGPNPWYEVKLTEARRDTLRNALFRMGHPVEKLKRVGLANLELGKLASGEYRALNAGEVALLRRAVAQGKESKEGKRGKAKGKATLRKARIGS